MPYDRISASGVQHGVLSEVDQANQETARQNAMRMAQMAILQRQQGMQNQASSDSRYATDASLASQGTFAEKAALAQANESAQTQRYFGGLDRTMKPGMQENELNQRKYQDQLAQRQTMMDYLKAHPEHGSVNMEPGTAGSTLAGPPQPGAQPRMVEMDNPNGKRDSLMLQIMASQAGLGNINVPNAQRETLQDRLMQAQIDAINRETKKQSANDALSAIPEGSDPLQENKLRVAAGGQSKFTPLADVENTDQNIAATKAATGEAMGQYNLQPVVEDATYNAAGKDQGYGVDLKQGLMQANALQRMKQFNIFDALHSQIQAAKAKGVNPQEIIAQAMPKLREVYGPAFVLPSWVIQ